jgi:hypothetical protein
VGGGRNKNCFWGNDILIEVVEGYQLVKLFAATLMKKRWEVVETKKYFVVRTD